MNTCFHSSTAGKGSDPLTPFQAAGNYTQVGKQEGIKPESLQERLGCPEVGGLPMLAYTLPFHLTNQHLSSIYYRTSAFLCEDKAAKERENGPVTVYSSCERPTSKQQTRQTLAGSMLN